MSQVWVALLILFHVFVVWKARNTRFMIYTINVERHWNIFRENCSNWLTPLKRKHAESVKIELRTLTEQKDYFLLCSSIVKRSYGLSWDDVQGNDQVKQILHKGVLLPIKHPNLFTALTKPWNGILLHGASGVGKTQLARALCSETFGLVTFFNISASTLISKWRGESEKFLKVIMLLRGNSLISFSSF